MVPDQDGKPKIAPVSRGDGDRATTAAVAMTASFAMGGVAALLVQALWLDWAWDRMTFCGGCCLFIILVWFGQGVQVVQDLVRRR
jgi:hypothetical protein